MSNFFDLEK
jgi:hypothetical protein